MSKGVLHQLLVGAAPGDAITDQAFAIRKWLRSLAFQSEIFAESIHPAVQDEVRPCLSLSYVPAATHLIYHYSMGSSTIDQALSLPQRLIIIYHNVTPPQFLAGADPLLAVRLADGRERLPELVGKTDLALGDSQYNCSELVAAGFRDTGVLPITLAGASVSVPPATEVLSQYRDGAINMLCVGRLVPNKRQEDAVKVLYFLRSAGMRARLILVGSDWLPSYRQWLDDFIESLDLANDVIFAGHVTQAVLNAHYQVATVYLSLSEHEGFCKPIAEAMYFGLPIIAFKVEAVAETLGGAGILVTKKDFAAIAELVHLVAEDSQLRATLIQRGRQRADDFTEARVKESLCRYLSSLGLC
ncbi:MAG: glycosyltransferase [Anaerolineae bacterium]